MNESDYEILDALKNGYIETKIFNELCSMHNDDLKEQYIQELINSKKKQLLILSLEDEEKRNFYMRNFKEEEIYETAITICGNDEILIRYLPYIKDDDNCYGVLENIISEANLERCLDYLIKITDYEEILDRFKNLDRKLRVLKRLDLSNDQIFDYLEMLDFESKEYLKNGLFDQEYIKSIRPQNDKSFNIVDYIDALPKRLTFGIEIECIGDKSLPLKLFFKNIFNYKIDEDDSLTNGVEFISSIMSWSEKDLESIYKICSYAKGLGLSVDETCGGHIHLSSDYLSSYDAWMWFFYLYASFEKILYLISNKEKTIPRGGIIHFAMPFSADIEEKLNIFKKITNKDDLIKAAQNAFAHKMKGINLDNIFERFNTIEFRFPNASLEADDIILNILLLGNLLVISEKLSKLPMNKDIHKLIEYLDKGNLDESQKLEILLNLLFKDENLKDIFRKRFKANMELYNLNNTIKIDDVVKSFKLKQMNFFL